MRHSAELLHYQFRGIRALVLLHEREMRRFLDVWRRAKAAKVTLPQTDDPDYESLEHLLRHVLRAARGYMIWMCEKLELPDPQIDPIPGVEEIESEANASLEHILERWREPLAGVDEERASFPSFKSRWNMDYSIESMLEHAVVHPMRHVFQLEELLA